MARPSTASEQLPRACCQRAARARTFHPGRDRPAVHVHHDDRNVIHDHALVLPELARPAEPSAARSLSTHPEDADAKQRRKPMIYVAHVETTSSAASEAIMAALANPVDTAAASALDITSHTPSLARMTRAGVRAGTWKLRMSGVDTQARGALRSPEGGATGRAGEGRGGGGLRGGLPRAGPARAQRREATGRGRGFERGEGLPPMDLDIPIDPTSPPKSRGLLVLPCGEEARERRRRVRRPERTRANKSEQGRVLGFRLAGFRRRTSAHRRGVSGYSDERRSQSGVVELLGSLFHPRFDGAHRRQGGPQGGRPRLLRC